MLASMNWETTKMISSDWKDTNPKDAVGFSKNPYSYLPAIVVAETGVAMFEGGVKYGAYNYREAGVRASIYYDAARRHLDEFWELGEDIDGPSGISHITKAIAGLMVLRDAQIRGMLEDDRPPPVERAVWEELERKTKALIAKYPNPVPRVTRKSLEKKQAQWMDRAVAEVKVPDEDAEAARPDCTRRREALPKQSQ